MAAMNKRAGPPILPAEAFACDETALQPERAAVVIRMFESWILSGDRTLDELCAWASMNVHGVLSPTTLFSPQGDPTSKMLTPGMQLPDGVILLPLGMPQINSDRVRETALWVAGIARGRIEARGFQRTGAPSQEGLDAMLRLECWLLAPDRTLTELGGWVRASLWPILSMTSRFTPQGVNEVVEAHGAVDVPDELSPFVQDLGHLRHLALWLIGIVRGFAESGVAVAAA